MIRHSMIMSPLLQLEKDNNQIAKIIHEDIREPGKQQKPDEQKFKTQKNLAKAS